MAESVPGYEARSWFGLFAPAATPKEVVAKWHADAVAVLAIPEISKRIVELGFDVVGNSSEAFGALVREDIAKWQRVVKLSGAKVD
jgi:tripartite-type tricarboxylate transporter receptor subunit TctC